MRIPIGLFISMVCSCALAEGRPSWIFATPKPDATYKYYLGRSSGELSEQAAWRLAKDQALESAVRENFGVETSISAATTETAKEVSLDRRVQELFPNVRLVDFEQVDSYLEENGGAYSVWVKFRYPRAQIESERERLKSVEPLPIRPFNEVGQSEIAFSTALEVISEPAGIPVFIDSERWGVTPLRVMGVLPAGVRRVRLSHPAYEDIDDDVVLMKGATRKIHHRMKAAVGWVRVSGQPSGAEVFIEGVRMNDEPVRLLAGRPRRIEVRKEGYETQIQIVQLQKGEVRALDFILNSNFKADSARLPQSEEPEGRSNWIWGFVLGISGASAPKPNGLSTFGYGVTLERRFLYVFGLRAGASYEMALDQPKENRNSQGSALSGTNLFLGLPVYFSTGDSGFYVMPEVGTIRHQRMLPYSNSEYVTLSAPRKGGRLGYMSRGGHVDIWVGLYEYDWREQGTIRTGAGGITFIW